ncbi:MAG: hypothetical protein ACLGJB_07165 [Blastocatellia bacterium]
MKKGFLNAALGVMLFAPFLYGCCGPIELGIRARQTEKGEGSGYRGREERAWKSGNGDELQKPRYGGHEGQ